MKKLAFLLLLMPMLSIGQIQDKNSIYYHLPTEKGMIKDQGLDSFNCEDVEFNFLVSWLRYEITCYNDSTIKTIHIGGIGNCYNLRWSTLSYIAGQINDLDCENPAHENVKFWIHKQPTFQGYIKWLKLKYL